MIPTHAKSCQLKLGVLTLPSGDNKSDFQRFAKALQQETALLQSWHDNQQLADSGFMEGFEL